MKKIFVFAFLMAAFAAAGVAQESRQDISISGTGWIEPFVAGPVVRVHSNVAYGVLGSYRFMLTPSSALEANYGITYANKIHYTGPALGTAGVTVNTRTQELSAAYVRSFNWKRWNPFVEAGPGVVIFLPIINASTTTHDVKQQTTVAGFYGAGIAYELSPSFDLRAEYRGIITKVPNFNATPENLTTNKYYNIYVPTIGVAYHF
jgi:opacity protein-like surface antigen